MPSTSASRPRPKRIGITLITGFLGSGKSTLIHRLLTEQHGHRLVVVENEFSSTAAVEKAIVTTGLPSTDSSEDSPSALAEFVELPNGCICCAAQDELADALDRLVARRASDFDHIVVEASGLADPGPVAASLWVDERADDDDDNDDNDDDDDDDNDDDCDDDDVNDESSLNLDAVVTVVDAVNFQPLLKREDASAEAVIARKQLALADLVLLNKVDLIGGPESAEVASLTDVLRACGCSAPIITTVRCDVRLSQLLGIKGYNAAATESAVQKLPPELSDHSHGAHATFMRLNIEYTQAKFEPAPLNRALGELLWKDEPANGDAGGAPQMEIWRMKALVVVRGHCNKRIYQSVHTLFDDNASSIPTETDEEQRSSFLFIGQRLQEEVIRRSLNRAIAVEEQPT